MSYDSRTRDRYRLAVRATTATVAAGAMSATGWLAGAAAQDQAKDTAEKEAAAQAAEAARLAQTPRIVVRERPTTTRVTTRYITVARSSDAVGGGGDVSSDDSGGSDSGGGDSGGGDSGGGDSGGGGGSSAPAPSNGS